MKFGWCTDIQNIALAEKLGFDYLEGIAAAVAAMDEDEFSQALSLVSGSAISPEAFCVMFGGGIKLTGDDARAGDIDEYCARLFSRLARLGGKTAVFGSGRARNVPDGFDHARAFDQLVRFCRIIASRAAENGLVVALEPLRPDECNIINTSAEAASLVNAVDVSSFRLLLDYYHMAQSGDSAENAVRFADMLVHTHIAHPVTRKNPVPSDGGGYESFFSALRRGGYDSRISFEGSVERPDAELPATLSLFRSLAE